MVEREPLQTKEQSAPLPDFELLVNKYKFGDQDAFEEIDNSLRPRLYKYFLSRTKDTTLKNDTEDFVQFTMEEIIKKLPKFTSRDKQKDYSRQFLGWCFALARTSLKQGFNHEDRLKPISIDSIWSDDDIPDEHKEHFVDAVPQRLYRLFSSVGHEDTEDNFQQEDLLKNRLAEILTERQKEIVFMVLDGKNNSEIACVLEVTERVVKDALTQAREKIEREIIFPAGYTRIPKGLSWITRADDYRKRERMDTVRFLRFWYVPNKAVEQHQAQGNNHYDKELIDKGYLPLSQAVSSTTYMYILRHWSDLLVTKDRRLYIHTENLPRFKQIEEEKSSLSTKIIPPTPQHKPLNTFATTKREIELLRRACGDSRLKAVKHNGMWFATPGDVDKFWQERGVHL